MTKLPVRGFSNVLLTFWILKGFSISDGADERNVRHELFLKPNAILSSQIVTQKKVHGNAIFDRSVRFKTANGTEYRLKDADTFPLTTMFSSDTYDITNGKVVDKKTGKAEPVYVFRGIFANGAVVQYTVDDEGAIVYMEVHETGKPTTFLLKNDPQVLFDDPNEGSFFTFTSRDLDQGRFRLHDELRIPMNDNGDLRHLRANHPRRRAGSGPLRNLAGDCQSLKTVYVAIAYDAEFCEMYGGYSEATSEIQSIVAGASILYEEQLCLTISITNILPPETCSSYSYSRYQDMNRENPCVRGEDTRPQFISQFAELMDAERTFLGVPESAAVHFFTGYKPQTAQLGCSYTGGYCTERWGYGVNFLRMEANNPAPQLIIFAHELAHTLSARHYYGDDQTQTYIMMPWLTSGNQGFSQNSIDSIHAHLDSVTCGSDYCCGTSQQANEQSATDEDTPEDPPEETPEDPPDEPSNQIMDIASVFLWPNYDLYFFYSKGNEAMYSRFEMDGLKVDESYPSPVVGSWGNWLSSDWVPTAAFVYWKWVYLLKGREFVRYSLFADRVVDSSPRPFDWVDLDDNEEITCSVLFPNGELYLFVGNGKYYMYDMNNDVAGQGYPKSIDSRFRNWPRNFHPTGAFVTTSEQAAYFFGKTNGESEPSYIRYNIANDSVDVGYPKDVRSNFPGVV